MDAELKRFLRTLLTPDGFPPAGRLQWEAVDMLGDKAAVGVEWTPQSIEVVGDTAEGHWRIALRKQGQGWESVALEGAVGGGTPLAQIRWAKARVEHIANANSPMAEWATRRPRRGPGA